MTYKCLSRQSFKNDLGYELVPIREQDIESIRLWRNAQLPILRQKTPITEEQQQRYFKEVVFPHFAEEKPSQILFSLLFHNTCIGYGGLVHIDWEARRAEVSFLLDTAYIDKQPEIFIQFVKLLFEAAFRDLKLHRLSTETYAFRTDIIDALENMGFHYEGRIRDQIFKRGKWEDALIHGLLFEEACLGISDRPVWEGILISSVSKKTPLVSAVRKAAYKLNRPLRVYGCDSDEQCVAKYLVDIFWHCPPLSQMTPESLKEYCLRNNIKVIIPTRDGELAFYAKHREWLKQQGIDVMVSGPEAIERCLDKKVFADYLIDQKLPAIPTTLSSPERDTSFYVVKERYGAGSLSLGLKLSQQEAIAHAKKLQSPVFQPYVEGIEYSVDLYRERSGNIKGCVARRRDVVVHGESQVTTTVRKPVLEELCMKAAKALDVYGHVIFQVMETPDQHFHFIECNPRFGGASTASVAAGLDTFYWFLLECYGGSLNQYPFYRSQEELRLVRYPVDKILNNASC